MSGPLLMSDDVHPFVAAMPRVKLVCGRDVNRYRGWQIGALWDANPWPRLGELVYRRQFLIRFTIDTGFPR